MDLPVEEMMRRATIISQSYEGIDPRNLEIYKVAIELCADRAFEYYGRYLDGCFESKADHEIYSSYIAMIINIAALNRFFWPPPPHRERKYLKEVTEKRGKRLRAEYGICEDSPLADRTLRNLIEHYEEYLDEYLLKFDAGIMIASPIVTTEIFSKEEQRSLFACINPQEGFAIILGRKIFHNGLIDELNRYFRKC